MSRTFQQFAESRWGHSKLCLCLSLHALRASVLLAAVLSLGAIAAVMAEDASAHHQDPTASPGYDGKMKSLGDFKRIGDRTYRFVPELHSYEVREPGEPTFFVHGDPRPSVAESNGVAAGPNTFLPSSELAPICRTEGPRIAVVYSHAPGDATPTPVGTLRSIVRRMNWKFSDQSSRSSGGSRAVRMAVDCDAKGEINVYNVSSAGIEFDDIDKAVAGVGGTNGPIKHLVFDTRVHPKHAGIASGLADNRKGRQNLSATTDGTAIIHSGAWETHVTLHELLHTFGATQGSTTPSPPYSTNGMHCIDGLDVLCYDDETGSDWGWYKSTYCPESAGYAIPENVPVDCGNNTYFDAAATPGTYLSEYWNAGEPENPFLAVPSWAPPVAATGAAWPNRGSSFASPSAGLTGSVTPNGDYVTYWFEWGLTPSYGAKSAVRDGGWGGNPNAVQVGIPGLEWGKTYYYRLAAKSELGTVYGAQKTLVTTLPPAVNMGSASAVTTTTATLNGTVDPEGASTTYQFEYGLTTAYGSTVPAVPKSAGSGSSPVAASQAIGGLEPGVRYHYRLRATNSDGTTFGTDRTFTAKDIPPVFTSSLGSSGSGNGQLDFPRGIVADGTGSFVWVADGANNRLQKFNVNTGEYLLQFGSTGTGNGQFRTPVDIAMNSFGHLWVTDALNGRVQRFNPEGVYISQFGAGQLVEPSGIALDAGGNLWVSDHVGGTLKKFTSGGEYILTASGGPGLASPSGVAIDPEGDVWVADMGGNKVVEYSASGQYKSHFGSWGTGNGQFQEPSVIDITSSGNVWVADRYTGRAQELSQTGEYLTQFGKGQLAEPGGIAIGPNSAIYVSNSLSADRVEKWQQLPPEAETADATDVAATQATMNGSINPRGLPTTYYFEYGPDTFYGQKAPTSAAGAGSGSTTVQVSAVVDGLKPATTYHFRVVASGTGGLKYGQDKVFKTGNTTKVLASTLGSSGSGNGQLNYPRGIAADGTGTFIWVADGANNRLQKFNVNTGEYLLQFGSTGTGNGQFRTPVDIAVNGFGELWVTDALNGRVQRFGAGGAYMSQFGAGQLVEPSGIALDAGGNLWVSDHVGGTLKKFTSGGEYILTASGGPGLASPSGVAIDPEGDVWVADMGGNKVVEYSASGQYKSHFGSWGTGNGQFQEPSVIDITSSGVLLVADRYTGRVQEFAQPSTYLGQFGGGQLAEPGGIAVGAGGVAYVSNSLYANRVEKWVEATAPAVTTGEATNVTSRAATIAANVNPNGQATTYRFEYGPTTAYGSSVPIPDKSAGAGMASVAVNETIGGLEPSSTYHYRVVAKNASGVKRGQDRTFDTTPSPPIVTTEKASDIGSAGATLRGSVNPEGFATLYWFEYGKTTDYGLTTAATEAGSGMSPVAVNQSVAKLEPGATYHFRLVASNSEGVAYGNDMVFTPTALAGMAVTEPFDGSTASLASFAADWSALGWAGGTTPKGEDATSGWRSLASHPTVNGAYYEPTSSDTGTGIAAVATMAVHPLKVGHGFSLWLDMPTPAGAKAGYELKFTVVSGGAFDVTLSKWQEGTQTPLASQAGVSFPAGSSLALVDSGGAVSAWTDLGSGFEQLLSANDGAFSGGNAGISGSGGAVRLTRFKAGSL